MLKPLALLTAGRAPTIVACTAVARVAAGAGALGALSPRVLGAWWSGAPAEEPPHEPPEEGPCAWACSPEASA